MADASRIRVTKFCQTDARRVHHGGGPWYIPVKEEYPNGGYKVSVASCEPEIDDVLTEGNEADTAGGKGGQKTDPQTGSPSPRLPIST
ncbi:MAG: hypothetical protein IAG10_03245 [Planctomycetaceae bacterium]|nr:hypothetical protein [Planctomycetaceae bacterium]